MYTVKRKAYLEIIRIVAVLLVIYNHLPGYHLYMVSSGMKQGITMFLAMLTRSNVPLFLMVSGTLLLSRTEDFIQVFKKRVIRICLTILIFECGIFLYHSLTALYYGGSNDLTIIYFLLGMISGTLQDTGSYWYLYAYLGMLLTLPFLQRIAKKMERQDFWALLILHFVFSSMIPIIEILLPLIGIDGFRLSYDFNVPFATMKILFYPLLGYYIDNIIDMQHFKRRHIFLINFAALIGIILSCLCTYYEGAKMGAYTQNYVQLFDYVTAIAIFVSVKYMTTVAFPKLVEGKLEKGFCLIGSLTFGIYLLDPLIKLFLYDAFEAWMEPLLPTLFVSIGWCLVSLVLGGFCAFILKKIPLLRKIM